MCAASVILGGTACAGDDPPPPVLRGTRRRARGRLPPGDGSVALQVRRERAAGEDLSGGVRRGLCCAVGAVRAVRGGAAGGEACACCRGRGLSSAGAMPMRVFSRLWDQLVPDSGQCQTLQGEAFRILGRVGYEVYENGGINWGRSCGALLDQYLIVVRLGLSMPPSSVARAEAAVASLKGRSMSVQAVDDITELAVEWVRLNPVLVEMDLPDVGR